VASCTNCTTIVVAVDPLQASDILCTITNTNNCESAVCNPPIDPECDNGQTCNPATGLCENNFVPASTPCTSTDGNTCTVAGCDGAGSCDQEHLFEPNSTPCADTDGNLCTTAGCNNVGVCDQNHVVTTCPGQGGQCGGAEFCNPATGLCEEQDFAPLSTPCEADGNLCTTDHCDGQGNCVFLQNVSCQGPTGPCDGGEACDPGSGNCVPLPDEPASTPCEVESPPNLCTVDHCDGNGQCVFQSNVTCPGPTGECDGGEQCDPGSGSCVPLPDPPANTPCTDTDPDDCAMAACDGSGNCNQLQILEPPSTPCADIDNNACTTAGCDGAGTCDQVHIEQQCPVSACSTGACDPQTGECIPEPVSTPCEEDGDLCTTDHCNGNGLCVFESSVSCPGPTGPCDGGEVCNEQTGACEPQPDQPSSTPCEADGDQCTIDHCDGAGSCVNESTLNCQPPNLPCEGGEECNPATGQCDPLPDGPPSTPCPDTDQNVCTTAGCDGAGGCDQGHLPNDGLGCDDGAVCTTGDVCTGGACGGTAVDCSAAGDQCNTASCDPGGGGANCDIRTPTNEGGGCDDGSACTTGDVCTGGACGGTAVDCSAAGDQCNTAACDPAGAGANCDSRTPTNEGQLCDNGQPPDGDPCAGPPVCVGGVCGGGPGPLGGVDHYKCYKTRLAESERQRVALTDQFMETESEVVRGLRLCNPVDKNSEGICDPTAHLSCYKIKEPRMDRVDVIVENQFGTQALTVKRADSLCVPAEKDQIPSQSNINHFKCYRVSKTRGAERFTSLEVELEDQFETKRTLVIKPSYLCNPVDKNGEGIVNAAGHLACYRIKDVPGQPKFQTRTVDVSDQFVTSLGLRAVRGDCRASAFVCVPSTKRHASPSGAFLEVTGNVLD
jgi:hypothetical protein